MSAYSAAGRGGGQANRWCFWHSGVGLQNNNARSSHWSGVHQKNDRVFSDGIGISGILHLQSATDSDARYDAKVDLALDDVDALDLDAKLIANFYHPLCPTPHQPFQPLIVLVEIILQP